MYISRQHSAARHYGAFLKGLLDYLELFTDPQLRKVFAIFGSLACGADAAAAEVSDMIGMLVSKHLGHPALKFKRVGVIGGITLLKRVTRTCSAELLQHGTELLARISTIVHKAGVCALVRTLMLCLLD